MEALAKNKGAIIGGIILLAGLYGYNTFISGTIDSTPPAANVGADLIKVSDNISRATLSRELFSTAGYKLLSDWSTPLQPQVVGRANPFAPIGQ